MNSNFLILLLFQLGTLTKCQKIRFEGDSTTSGDSDGQYQNKHNLESGQRTSKDEAESDYKNHHGMGKATNDIVSKQYIPQIPSYPSSFQSPYSKNPSSQFGSGVGSNWQWSSSSSQSRKPTYIQFPGESFSIGSFPSPYNSIGSSSYNGNRREPSFSSSGSANVIDESCQCGMVPFEKDSKKLQRIVGGIISKQNSWPWMVAIAYMRQGTPFWFCGGSLISDKFVLTAAHCLRTIKTVGFPNIKLIMGTNYLNDTKSAVFYSVKATRKHPLYKSGTEDYDVALLEVKEKVNFTSRVSPICLKQESDTYVNRSVIVAGWGSLQNGEGPPADLREVDLKVVPNDDCQKEYYYNYRTSITSAMLCAWLPGKDSCQGDSGGPLFLKSTSAPFSYSQIGIVSFGPPECGKTTIPGVYSKVASAVRWIKSVTKTGKFCKGSF